MRGTGLKLPVSDLHALPTTRPACPSFGRMRELTDNELMAELQTGHGDALAGLFDCYHRLVLSIALKIVRDRAEAEDVMQNVFLESFRAVANLTPPKAPLRRGFFSMRIIGLLIAGNSWRQDTSIKRRISNSSRQACLKAILYSAGCLDPS